MQCNGMEWNGMQWDGMGWNAMQWDGTLCAEIEYETGSEMEIGPRLRFVSLPNSVSFPQVHLL